MTVPARNTVHEINRPSRSAGPDRRILSSAEVEALSLFLERFSLNRPTELSMDLECKEELVSDDCQIDVHLRRVLRGGVPVHLTPRECELLLALARRDGAPVSADELVRDVWRGDVQPGSRTLSQHIMYVGLRDMFADYATNRAPQSPTSSTLAYYRDLEKSYGGPLIPPAGLLRQVIEDFDMEGQSKPAHDAWQILVDTYGMPKDSADWQQRLAKPAKMPPLKQGCSEK